MTFTLPSDPNRETVGRRRNSSPLKKSGSAILGAMGGSGAMGGLSALAWQRFRTGGQAAHGTLSDTHHCRYGILVWLLALLVVLVPPVTARGQSVWQLTPYRIQTVLAFGEHPSLTSELKADLAADLVSQTDSLIGAAWDLTVVSAPAALERAVLDDIASITPEVIPQELLTSDKLMLLAVSPRYGGYLVAARELDVRTRTFNSPVRLVVGHSAGLHGATFRAVRKAFAPLAEIVSVEEKRVVLRLRASGFPPRDPTYEPVRPGGIFQSIVRYDDREGRPKRISVIPWTYLYVENVSGTALDCRLYSGLRSPLSARRRGRTSQYALAVVPPTGSTRLSLKSNAADPRGLVGYDIHRQEPGSKATELVGRTDRHGGLSIGVADSPLCILYVKHGGELLARLPMVPGVTPELEARIADDDLRLEAEGFIKGVQQDLVDLIARRTVLLARTRARIEAGKYGEAEELVEELQKLETRDNLFRYLNQEKEKIYSKDAAVQRRIDAMFDETQKAVHQYLDPGEIKRLSDELRKIQSSAA